MMAVATSLSQTGVLIVLVGGLVQIFVLSMLLARSRQQLGRVEGELAALKARYTDCLCPDCLKQMAALDTPPASVV